MPLIRVSDSVYEWLNAVKNAKGLSSINDAIATLKNPNPGFPREVYSLTVTVPASTMITREENYIKFGEDVVITKVYVFFPDGCFLPGTPIMLEDGLEKPIEEVKVGDRVLSHMCVSTVTKTFTRKYVGWVYRIKPLGLPELIVTPEHPFLAIRRKKGNFRFKFQPEWIRACDLKPGYWVVSRIPTKVEDKKEIKLDPTKNKKICRLPVNDELLEFIGYWLAEGWVSEDKSGPKVCLCFGTHEREKVNRLVEIIKSFGFSPYVNVRESKHTVEITFYSRTLHDWLLKNFGKGAKTKRVPSWVMKLPFHKQEKILMSMLKGDGYLHPIKNSWVLHTANLELTRRMWILANRVGYNPIIYDWAKQGYGMEFRLKYTNNRRIKLLDIVLSPIHKIEREWYEGEVYNLEVEPYNTYIANFVCVHNCEDLLTVVLGAGSKEYAPKIISGDNKSLWIEPKLFVPAGTPIWAEIRNEDTTYPHTPTIEVEVEKIGKVELV